jgi:ABC-type histidine transport system ATPase subunit
MVYRQGDMFRLSLGHPQALKESRSKITYMFYRNSLWDHKRLQNVIEVQYKICNILVFVNIGVSTVTLKNEIIK